MTFRILVKRLSSLIISCPCLIQVHQKKKKPCGRRQMTILLPISIKIYTSNSCFSFPNYENKNPLFVSSGPPVGHPYLTPLESGRLREQFSYSKRAARQSHAQFPVFDSFVTVFFVEFSYSIFVKRV